MKYECKFKHCRKPNGGPGDTRYVYTIPATVEAGNLDEAFNTYHDHLLKEKDRWAHYLEGKIIMYVITDEDDDLPDDFPRWYERTVVIPK